MKKRAKSYFLLAEQYGETANLLLETLCNNGNTTWGIGNTQKEAEEKMQRNASKSDSSLFVPAIFLCLQSTELFIKGILLLNEVEIDGKHDMQHAFGELEKLYSPTSPLYKEFKRMYHCQKEIMKQYRDDNHITNSHDLYMSLRYPEKVNPHHTPYTYYALMHNGEEGIKLFRSIQKNLSNIKNAVLEEYNRLFDN